MKVKNRIFHSLLPLYGSFFRRKHVLITNKSNCLPRLTCFIRICSEFIDHKRDMTRSRTLPILSKLGFIDSSCFITRFSKCLCDASCVGMLD